MPPRAATPPPTAPPTIVFADNDGLVLETIGELLRSKGYDVHVAEDGLAAWQLIRTRRPTCVILDVVMPKLDGSQVCWLVRQDPTLRKTPIIVFPSLAAQDFRHFPNLSADAYVAKEELSAAFQNILQARTRLQPKGRTDLAGGIFGYDAARPREIVAEMLPGLRRYRSLLSALGPGTIELDADGRILRISAGAREILGRRETQVLGGRDHPVLRSGPGDPSATPARTDDRRATGTLPGVGALRRPGDPIHPCSLVHEGRCNGFLLVLETKGTPDEATGGPRGESTASAAGCPVGAELCVGLPDGLRTHP